VLDSEVDALLDVPVLHLLVDDNTDCTLCDVVDDTGLSVWVSVSICILVENSGASYGKPCVACPSAQLRWP